MSKLDPRNLVPDGYEVLETLVTSESAWEYLACDRAKNTLVRLKVYSFADTTEATRHRHIRSYLRKDVGFMDELDHPGIIKLYDYSETRQLFWLATQPIDAQKLSDVFPNIATLPFETKVALIEKLFSILEYVHDRQVVHRNLSSEGVYLGPKLELYVGDFGLACYLEDASTSGYSTTSTSTLGAAYQAPEIKDAQTAFLDFRSDVFTAGLLAIEILCGRPVPKDTQKGFSKTLRQYLEKQGIVKYAGSAVCKVLLKAIRSDNEKRWATIKDMSNAFGKALQNRSADPMVTVGLTGTVDITKTIQSSHKVDDIVPTETISTGEGASEPSEPGVLFTPRDPQNEIWNNRYEIIEKIGGGGQAVVYKAIDHFTNEEIAIKTLLSRHRKDKHAINRLKQEAMVARSLTHKYIIKTYSVEQRTDILQGSGSVFLCMELITSGLELKDVISKRRGSGKKFSVEEVLHVIRQLLDALKYAHSFTVHRDIKPGNIMLVPKKGHSEDDTSDLTKFDIILMDFGIAKVLTQKRIEVTGKGFWSAHYGAPELADSRSTVDPRADLFSTGIIMYQMFTGHIPRKGSQPVNKVNKNVSVVLSRVIDKAIDADREKRFKNAASFMKEIDKATSRFSWISTAGKVAVLFLLVLTGIAAILLWPKKPEIEIDKCLSDLGGRGPSMKVVSFENVNYQDIEAYNKYQTIREITVAELKKQRDEWGSTHIKTEAKVWRNQEDAWKQFDNKFLSKTKQIFENRKNCEKVQGLEVLHYLQDNELLKNVKNEMRQADNIISKRPLTDAMLDDCDKAYSSAWNHYGYIEVEDGKLIGDPSERAEEINKKLTGLAELRNNVDGLEEQYLLAVDALGQIPELQGEEFKDNLKRCLDRVKTYRAKFDFEGAEKHLSLLNEIFGTLVSVKDQIDFGDSTTKTVISRLIELCHEEIETFENYPDSIDELKRVHEKKYLITKYALLGEIIYAGPKTDSQNIYDLMETVRNEENTKEQRGKLQDTTEKYKEFLAGKVSELTGDIDALPAGPDISKDELQTLQDRILGSDWPTIQNVEEYNSYSERAKKYLAEKVVRLRENIVKNIGLEKTEYNWKSQYGDYMAGAKMYSNENITQNIKNWKDIDNTHRLFEITKNMQAVDVLLDRKVKLDQLASKIDEGIDFCNDFNGTTSKEISDRKRWLSGLEEFSEKANGLIDESEFDWDHENITGKVKAIHAQFPVNSKRVEELISHADFLEGPGLYIDKSLDAFRSIVGDGKDKIEFKSTTVCTDLGKLKEGVNSLGKSEFNEKMKPKCQDLAKVVNKEIDTLRFILAAVKKLDTTISNILSDKDIQELNSFATAGGKKFVFEQLIDSFDRSRKTLDQIKTDGFEKTSPVEINDDFDTEKWLIKYNDAEKLIKGYVVQVETIMSGFSNKAEVVKQLKDVTPVEKVYFSELKNAITTALKQQQTQIVTEINAVEGNTHLMEICNFLKRLGDDTIPELTTLKQTYSVISSDITKLESLAVGTLSAVKGFNAGRKKVLEDFAKFDRSLAMFNESEAEVACKNYIENSSKNIRKLTPGRVKLLWEFYPKNEDWDQWQSFFDVFHVKIAANGTVQLSSFPQLEMLNTKGNLLRQAEIIENPQTFFNIDTKEPSNFGWARYVRSKKDPNVQFVFIPAETNNSQPFYMATHEATNNQYCIFLNKTGAKKYSKSTDISPTFLTQDSKYLIRAKSFAGRSYAIKHDDSNTFKVRDETKNDYPVTWVTFQGADFYAKWLGGQLPTASQYKYACRANANMESPWWEKDKITDYAHIRAAAWKKTANDYNGFFEKSERAQAMQIKPPFPMGAVKESDFDDPIAIANVLSNNSAYKSAWPLATKTDPNPWGLYDMIGNVWEWCIDGKENAQKVICGGSCLAPPEDISPDSRHGFKNTACDVGFRVIIPAK